METEAARSNHHTIGLNIHTLHIFTCFIVCASTHPKVCMTVDHHGALDQLIGTLQEVMARDDAGVVDQYVYLSHLSADLLSRGIHTLTLPHITHIGVDLRLERRDLLYPSNRSCKGGKMEIR